MNNRLQQQRATAKARPKAMHISGMGLGDDDGRCTEHARILLAFEVGCLVTSVVVKGLRLFTRLIRRSFVGVSTYVLCVF